LQIETIAHTEGLRTGRGGTGTGNAEKGSSAAFYARHHPQVCRRPAGL